MQLIGLPRKSFVLYDTVYDKCVSTTNNQILFPSEDAIVRSFSSASFFQQHKMYTGMLAMGAGRQEFDDRRTADRASYEARNRGENTSYGTKYMDNCDITRKALNKVYSATYKIYGKEMDKLYRAHTIRKCPRFIIKRAMNIATTLNGVQDGYNP